MRTLTLVSIILSCTVLNTAAQIIHVPGDQPSIQAGIDAAADGDTVLVADSTYYENINFKGKAITLASHFIIDGDTSHISKTIIDGSQPVHQDTASVVNMISGEDTTSVLGGFTLTGGAGTYIYSAIWADTILSGGGLNIYNSGGKIEHNIIVDNHLPGPKMGVGSGGSGISAIVARNHTAIFRYNLVRNNTYNDSLDCLGGFFLSGGKFLVEDNQVYDNTIHSKVRASGGGIYYYAPAGSDAILEVIIRNNTIAGNEIYCNTSKIGGAGIYLAGANMTVDLKIYNNLIYENHAHDGFGGGIGMSSVLQACIFNNTIMNNRAELGGEQLHLGDGVNKAVLYNNILGSDLEDGVSEIYPQPIEIQHNVLIARYNYIRGGWPGEGNIGGDPGFEPGSFELAEGSLCIGRGVDSIRVDETWYYAPKFDLYRNTRPDNLADQLVDMGAIESGFYKSIPLILHDQWFSVPEHSPKVGTISLDTSKWESDSVSYSIIGGDPENIFEISSSTREILVPEPNKLDYEDTAYHNLLIEAVHSIVSEMTIDTAEIHIVLTDISDVSPVVYDTTFIYNMEEIQPMDIIGFIRAEDPDNFLTYEIIEGNINETFDLSYPGRIRIMKTDSLDCQYSLTVVVKELDGPQSDTAVVTIKDTVSVKCTVSIQDYSDYNSPRIYPNPASDILYIEWPDERARVHDVEIISLTGRSIYREMGHTGQIDISRYTRGLYFVKVRSVERVYVRKVVID